MRGRAGGARATAKRGHAGQVASEVAFFEARALLWAGPECQRGWPHLVDGGAPGHRVGVLQNRVLVLGGIVLDGLALWGTFVGNIIHARRRREWDRDRVGV